MPTPMPDRARLTYTEVVNWIAFCQPTQRDQTGRDQSISRWGEPFSVDNEPGVLFALRALNGGAPLWMPPNFGSEVLDEARRVGPTIPPAFARYHEEAQRSIRKSGKSAQQLIADLEVEYQDFREKKGAFDRAEQQLSDALATGDLDSAPVPPRIGAYAAVEGINGWESWFFKKDVLRLWPLTEAAPISSHVNRTGLPVSDQELRDWWDRIYVPSEIAAGGAPSREENHAAAAAAFPDRMPPTQERVFELRKRPITPQHWKRAGRRPAINLGK